MQAAITAGFHRAVFEMPLTPGFTFGMVGLNDRELRTYNAHSARHTVAEPKYQFLVCREPLAEGMPDGLAVVSAWEHVVRRFLATGRKRDNRHAESDELARPSEHVTTCTRAGRQLASPSPELGLVVSL
jgi:hypothetical protein